MKRLSASLPLSLSLAALAGMTVDGHAGQWSVAREWNEQVLAAIRIDRPRPPVHARNLYHVSAAMWDAWAAYDLSERSDQLFHHERTTAVNVEAARAEAISYAAYRLIRHRYALAFNPGETFATLDAKFAALGYDAANTSAVGNTPAALGNRIFQTIRDATINDGSNQVANYAPNNGYVPVNAEMIVDLPGTVMVDPNRWQPLALFFIKQNGIPVGVSVQSFVCPHWAGVTSFALTRPDAASLHIDPGPPPLLGGATDAAYKGEHSRVIEMSGQLDPRDGVMIDISPAARHNNPLGTNNGIGYALNPTTGLPYAPNVVKRADYARVLAEYWADGPDSETPPGHWNVVANQVGDTPGFQKRLGGTGPIVSDLEWDVKAYLAINGAVHDAAVCAWGIKGRYDSARPISAIRYMGGRGQSSDPLGPSYDPMGLPLQPGVVEVVTAASSAPGERHANLADAIGQVAIFTWLTQPDDPTTEIGGCGWVLAKNWKPYQKNTFVTPPFAGFTSGHSTFSRAAAEVMTGLTGTPFFPGGLKALTFNQGAYLTFEYGPSQTIQLQWATYFDAADEAGISRLYGGIHIASDDFQGRIAGSTVGKRAFAQAARLFAGRVSCPADFNGDRALSADDVFAYLDEWVGEFGRSGLGLASDFDADLTVGEGDLWAFVDAWISAGGGAGAACP